MLETFLLCCFSLQSRNEKITVSKSNHYSQAQAVLFFFFFFFSVVPLIFFTLLPSSAVHIPTQQLPAPESLGN